MRVTFKTSSGSDSQGFKKSITLVKIVRFSDMLDDVILPSAILNVAYYLVSLLHSDFISTEVYWTERFLPNTGTYRLFLVPSSLLLFFCCFASPP